MLDQNERDLIHVLYAQGKAKREIARFLGISARSVRRVLSGKGKGECRRDKKQIDLDLLQKVYTRCEGYIERVHEVLSEEHNIKIGYSTLTRRIRENELGQREDPSRRCAHVGDSPGAEMQHDTTVHDVMITGKKIRMVCSGLYLRYCKMRFIKFYPHFNRFLMKCFFHEALTHWGHAAGTCVIDNTNLAVWIGTGRNAVCSPEMVQFAKPYGFVWFAHEAGHANRKAGKERNFHTVETNFLPGRSFESLEDLNRQAFDWATVRYAQRPQAKTALIPIALFEEEKPFLQKLPAYLEPPYRPHRRITDQYGYIAFNANFYWIPGKARPEAKILEYPDKIKIFPKDQDPLAYPLPPWKTRNQRFIPSGVDPNPYQPNNRKKTCRDEEERLRTLGEVSGRYLDFIKSKEGEIKQIPRFIRQLDQLAAKLSPALWAATLQKALKHSVNNLGALARIAAQIMKQDLPVCLESFAQDYEDRETYRAGRFSKEENLQWYKDLFEDKPSKEGEKNHDGGNHPKSPEVP